MRLSRGLVAALLLAVALCLPAASPVSAADDPDGGVVGAEGSDVLRVVGSAQSDPDSEPDRRLVDRESSERIDAVVIALWTIAGVMTVLLGLFLWHTSPRRRLRLAGGGSAGSSGSSVGTEGGAGPVGEQAGEDEPGEDSSWGDFGAKVREALVWLRSRLAPQQESESVGDASRQESESVGDASRQESESVGDASRQESESVGDASRQESDGGSVDESDVWKFSEANGEQRSV